MPATSLATSLSAPAALHPARDLAAEARAAAARGEPLILMYSREGCAWCERLRREQLLPLLTGTAAPPVIREIHIDRSDALVDFDSRRTTSGEFARIRKMTLAPTLAFHGPDGRSLAEPIVGYRLPDFYGFYLERAIADARQNLAPGASR